ncbi:hypothetical protein JCM3770_001258, partial [Rhodotorula araucariae]
MAVHSATGRLFVFGGKNQPYNADASPSSSTGGASDGVGLDFGGSPGTHEGRYSGMWCYDISQRRWSHLFGDPRPSSFSRAPSPSSSDRLLSRAGHALALDENAPGGPTLYIRGGQRNEQYLADEWAVRLAAAPVAGADADETEGASDRELWRQGAVLDFPSAAGAAGAGSLVDPAALPVPTNPPNGGTRTREPTIVQIRRLGPTPGAGAGADTVPPAGFTQRLSLVPASPSSSSSSAAPAPATWTLLTGLTGHAALGPGAAGAALERDRERERAAERADGVERCVRGVWRRVGGAAPGGRWERVRDEGARAGADGDGEGERVGDGPAGRFAAQ